MGSATLYLYAVVGLIYIAAEYVLSILQFSCGLIKNVAIFAIQLGIAILYALWYISQSYMTYVLKRIADCGQRCCKLKPGETCHLVFAHPGIPLKFEKFNYTADEGDGDVETILEIEEYQAFDKPYPGILDNDLPMLRRKSNLDEFVNSRMKDSLISAVEAYGHPNPAASAKRVLKTKGENPEAYNILALFDASNYSEALAYYKKAINCASGILSGTLFHDVCNHGHCWDYAFTRPYIRALHGLANTYRKMGKYLEAEKAYKRLASIDLTYHVGEGYINWRYHYLEVLLKQNKDQEAWDAAHSDKMKFNLNMKSTMVAWNWCLALIRYRLEIQRGFEKEYFDKTCPGYINEFPNLDSPLINAILLNPEIYAFISGKRKLPSVRMPFSYDMDHDLVAAAIYASSHKSLWQGTPGAMEWLNRNINTMKCWSILIESKEFIDRFSLTNTYTCFKEVVLGGIYPNAIVKSDGYTLLHEAVLRCPRKLHCILRAGASPNVTPYGLEHYTPLYAVAAEDGPPMSVKYLLKFGGDPFAIIRDKNGNNKSSKLRRLMPIEEAMVHGHARIVYAMLIFSDPENLSFDTFGRLLRNFFKSEFYDCVTSGMKNKCYKCSEQHSTYKHSKYTNFEACITALLSTGYKPSQETMESLKKIKSKQRKSLMKHLESQMKLSTEELRGRLDELYGEFLHSCRVCNATTNLKKCTRCLEVRYCSRECQKKDWKDHKIDCKKTGKIDFRD